MYNLLYFRFETAVTIDWHSLFAFFVQTSNNSYQVYDLAPYYFIPWAIPYYIRNIITVNDPWTVQIEPNGAISIFFQQVFQEK